MKKPAMKMPKHTPGPWVVDRRADHAINVLAIFGADGTEVCSVHTESGLVTLGMRVDAWLIAAAPDLLDALRDITSSCRKWAPTVDRSRAEAALARATTGEGAP